MVSGRQVHGDNADIHVSDLALPDNPGKELAAYGPALVLLRHNTPLDLDGGDPPLMSKNVTIGKALKINSTGRNVQD